MKELNVSKVATTLALFLGGFHLVWSLLILIGIAQPLINFIFWAHMLANPYKVTGFSLSQAGALVVLTTVFGYMIGWIIATVWNKMSKDL